MSTNPRASRTDGRVSATKLIEEAGKLKAARGSSALISFLYQSRDEPELSGVYFFKRFINWPQMNQAQRVAAIRDHTIWFFKSMPDPGRVPGQPSRRRPQSHFSVGLPFRCEELLRIMGVEISIERRHRHFQERKLVPDKLHERLEGLAELPVKDFPGIDIDGNAIHPHMWVDLGPEKVQKFERAPLLSPHAIMGVLEASQQMLKGCIWNFTKKYQTEWTVDGDGSPGCTHPRWLDVNAWCKKVLQEHPPTLVKQIRLTEFRMRTNLDLIIVGRNIVAHGKGRLPVILPRYVIILLQGAYVFAKSINSRAANDFLVMQKIFSEEYDQLEDQTNQANAVYRAGMERYDRNVKSMGDKEALKVRVGVWDRCHDRHELEISRSSDAIRQRLQDYLGETTMTRERREEAGVPGKRHVIPDLWEVP